MIKVGLSDMITESVREGSKYGVIVSKNKEVSHFEQGYNILMKNNNQKVHGEGICWSINFESAIQRIGSEAEKDSITKMLEERKFDGQSEMTIVIMKGASYNFVECEAIVILNCISQRKVIYCL
jgi:hypothetical protein